MLYRRGLGVREDDLEASKWFILSSDQGNIDAMYELAEMKYCGLSFERNEKEAENLYYKSAIGGNINACTRLANIYLGGIDEVEQDLDRGLKMFDYAATRRYICSNQAGRKYMRWENTPKQITQKPVNIIRWFLLQMNMITVLFYLMMYT
jgi:TPR repeat protein